MYKPIERDDSQPELLLRPIWAEEISIPDPGGTTESIEPWFDDLGDNWLQASLK